jgi:GNAT superfamily N-acetyltransferase
MRVRLATSDDLPAVMNVLDGALLETEGIPERIECGDVLVAVADGRILGALVATPQETGVFVDAVAIRRARRGQGIGTALVERVAERGPVLVEFDARVKPFYDALGFDSTPLADGRYRGSRSP